VFNRLRDALARALEYRALCLAREHGPCAPPGPVPRIPGRDRADCFAGCGRGACREGRTCLARASTEPVRYPAVHSSGPPHVEGQVPPAPGPCPEPETVTCAGRVRLVGRSGCGCG
jgi:hypothetical protein